MIGADRNGDSGVWSLDSQESSTLHQLYWTQVTGPCKLEKNRLFVSTLKLIETLKDFLENFDTATYILKLFQLTYPENT